MSRKLVDILRPLVIFFLGFFVLFGEIGRSQDALHYFKNYFVTGDYVVGGVGLRGTGMNYDGIAPNPQQQSEDERLVRHRDDQHRRRKKLTDRPLFPHLRISLRHFSTGRPTSHLRLPNPNHPSAFSMETRSPGRSWATPRIPPATVHPAHFMDVRTVPTSFAIYQSIPFTMCALRPGRTPSACATAGQEAPGPSPTAPVWSSFIES